MGTNRKLYKLVPTQREMVYHEIRKVNGKKQNYLVHSQRSGEKINKKSKFIGYGRISQKEIERQKEKFLLEIIAGKKSDYLRKDQLILIEKLKQRYNTKIRKLRKEELTQLEKSFFTELTYNSNAIEGNTLSLEETSLIINEGLTPEGKTLREIHEARNHKEAIEFLRNFKGDFSEEFILKIHSIILKGISQRFSGKYRRTNVKIFGSGIKLPRYQIVPQLVKNLVYWYKKNKSKHSQFELAILVSMKFVTIHPFVDGNGRVSRLIMNFLLNRKDYPWINIYNKQRAKYLSAVRKANNEDYSEIFPFLVQTLKENLEDFGLD